MFCLCSCNRRFSCGGFLISGSQLSQYVAEVSGSSFLSSHFPDVGEVVTLLVGHVCRDAGIIPESSGWNVLLQAFQQF